MPGRLSIKERLVMEQTKHLSRRRISSDPPASGFHLQPDANAGFRVAAACVSRQFLASDGGHNLKSGRTQWILQSATITNSIGMQMKLIRAGEFLMGSPDSDEDADLDAKPHHRVQITTPFYLGVTAVTQDQYPQLMGDNPSHFRGDPRCPVEQVSWEDAVGFCRKLSEKDGRVYRLPTEAEWEYACRVGTTTKWCCGNDEKQLDRVAWYDANAGYATHPVGKKEPNAWDLYDMLGNVWEWCEDGWRNYTVDEAVDPKGPSTATGRVIRGGSWRSESRTCRSAFRGRGSPAIPFPGLGFRVAAVPPSQSSQAPAQQAEPGA
jgi:formylglycine-generating enzyme required for sulfatase activity